MSPGLTFGIFVVIGAIFMGITGIDLFPVLFQFFGGLLYGFGKLLFEIGPALIQAFGECLSRLLEALAKGSVGL